MINPRAICLEAISSVSNFKSNFTKAICNEKNVNAVADMIDSYLAICRNYDDLAYLYTAYNETAEGGLYRIGNYIEMWLKLQDNPIHQNLGKAMGKIYGKYYTGHYYKLDVFEAISDVEKYFNAFSTLMEVTK